MLRLYSVPSLPADITLTCNWNDELWSAVEPANVDVFRRESSDHRPRTQVKLLASDHQLYGIFRVEDRYVRCVAQRFQDCVCADSCVEFFVRPKGAEGYFNFEFSGNGVLLASYVVDPTRTSAGLKKFTMLDEAHGRQVLVASTLPARIDPEWTEPLEWTLAFSIPYAVMAAYANVAAPTPGCIWHANFYKCADRTSHPHWASWSPVPEKNFHCPASFGKLYFER